MKDACNDTIPKDMRMIVDFASRLSVQEKLLPVEIKHLAEIVDVLFKSKDEEHRVQAIEIEKRLVALNGEASRLDKIGRENVRQETYNGKVGELEKAIHNLELWQSNVLGKMAVAGLFGGIVASIVTAFVVKWIGQ